MAIIAPFAAVCVQPIEASGRGLWRNHHTRAQCGPCGPELCYCSVVLLPHSNGSRAMSHITYRVVQHDNGWAYTADGVFSEPFPTHAAALAAARRVAAEQRVPG